jgi:hypothetical protein
MECSKAAHVGQGVMLRIYGIATVLVLQIWPVRSDLNRDWSDE